MSTDADRPDQEQEKPWAAPLAALRQGRVRAGLLPRPDPGEADTDGE